MEQPGIVLINVFTVDPANQQRVVDLLTRATEDFVRAAPGFLSSTLHRSTDGTKVTMVAQWRSVEDYEAMRADPGPRPFWKKRLRSPALIPGCTKSSGRSGRPSLSSRARPRRDT